MHQNLLLTYSNREAGMGSLMPGWLMNIVYSLLGMKQIAFFVNITTLIGETCNYYPVFSEKILQQSCYCFDENVNSGR